MEAVFSTSKSASIISKKDLVASIQYRTNFLENIYWRSVVSNNIKIRHSKDLTIYLITRNPEIN